MSPSATPATQKWRGVTRHGRHARRNQVQARHPVPCVPNDGRCEVVPRLPREIKVDVSLCHACHAEVARRHGRHGRLNQVQARHPVPCVYTTPATQSDRGCAIVPRLPREIKVDVTKCHACHAEVARRHASRASRAPKPSPSAPPSAISATPANQVQARHPVPCVPNDSRCEVVPRLPREIKVDVTKCHACHAEVARRHGRHARLNQVQARHPVPCVPRLPRKTTVDVRLCHACHVKGRWM